MLFCSKAITTWKLPLTYLYQNNLTNVFVDRCYSITYLTTNSTNHIFITLISFHLIELNWIENQFIKDISLLNLY